MAPYWALPLIAFGLFTCSINSDVFYTWVTQLLLPSLPKNCVIVMDNASFHKRQDIQHAIINARHLTGVWPAEIRHPF
ncbi:transposase [Candidatus Fukatsuia endosymbiont of Tuberolachnus salignus]|uniref:transposase n=1 Tax=Candidatus Fukatsuia endosymbiont of Tuberolachnus salignus TaxID=3077957 RepID=UPI00313C2267